jgi:hypothetical protein
MKIIQHFISFTSTNSGVSSSFVYPQVDSNDDILLQNIAPFCFPFAADSTTPIKGIFVN